VRYSSLVDPIGKDFQSVGTERRIIRPRLLERRWNILESVAKVRTLKFAKL
jgi:hypothetical protein